MTHYKLPMDQRRNNNRNLKILGDERKGNIAELIGYSESDYREIYSCKFFFH